MDGIIRKINSCMNSFFEVLLMYTELDDNFYSCYPDCYDEDEKKRVLLAASFICEKTSVKVQQPELYMELIRSLSDINSSVPGYEDVMKLYKLCLDITKPFCNTEEFYTATGKTYYEELLDMDMYHREESNSDVADICNEITVTEIKRILNEVYGLKKSCRQIIKVAKELGYEYNVAYDTVVCPDVDRLVGRMNEGVKKTAGYNHGYKKKIAAAILGVALLSVLLAFKTYTPDSTVDNLHTSAPQHTESLTSGIASNVESENKEQISNEKSVVIYYDAFSMPVGSIVTVSGIEEDYKITLSDKRVISMISNNKISALEKGTAYLEIRKDGELFGIYRFDVE